MHVNCYKIQLENDCFHLARIAFKIMSEEQFFDVEKILDKRVRNGKAEYLVKWKGYSKSESTWEPIQNLTSVLMLVDEHERNRQSRAPEIKSGKKKRTSEDKISESRSSKPASRRGRHSRAIQIEEDTPGQGMTLDLSVSDSEESRSRSRDPKGTFEVGDRVDSLKEVKKDHETKKVSFLVEWKKRRNGTQPKQSWVKDDDLRIYDPDSLCVFLLSKIKWPSN